MNQGKKETPEEKEKDRKGLLNVWWWIVFPVLLLVVFNFIMFVAYQFTYPSVSIWGQLWGYIESDTFKLITVTLFLPILMFLLDAIFKIRGAVQERKQKDIVRQRERRWQCVEETSKTWNELYDLCTQVMFFKKNAKKDTHIVDILMKLRNYSSKITDLLNMWSYRFTNLSPDNINQFKKIFRFLRKYASYVAQFIMDNDDSDKIADLQSALGLVQRRIEDVIHDSILSILKWSIDILEESKPERECRTEEINEYLENLSEWVILLRQVELDSDDYYSTFEDETRKDLQKLVIEMDEWIWTNKPHGISGFPGFDNFRDLSLSVPREEHISSWEIYRREYLERLSDQIRFWYECAYLERRAGWERKDR